MSIVVVGSMAFDSIETPFGKTGKTLGGSANHFSLSASFFNPVKCITVVGEDFPADHLATLRARGIDTEGIRIEKGKTFHWSGSYGYELSEARTLATALNVFEKFEPEVPESYRSAPFVFLGNILPRLQIKVASQMHHPKFIAIDTMNFWIESQRDELIRAISLCQCVIINEGEARQLTKEFNIMAVAEKIKSWGPKILVIKRGEYGAILFNGEEIFSLPGLPLLEVKDPTGAGDSFAGGFMGYLAARSQGKFDSATLRKAVVYGSIMASFAVQEFGIEKLLHLNPKNIEERFELFRKLTHFDRDISS